MWAFSVSSPHALMAPRSEWNPSWGSTASNGRVSTALVLLLSSVTRSIRSPPSIACTSVKVRTSHLPCLPQPLDFADGRRMSAESVPTVDQHDRPSDAGEVHHPVEGRVAAAHDQDPLTGESVGSSTL